MYRSATYVREAAKKQKVGEAGQTNGSSEVPVEVSREKDGAKEDSDRISKVKEKYELSSLVKSVKMKSKELALSRSQQDRTRRQPKSGK